MKNVFLLVACILLASVTYSQNVGVGTPTPSALLHIKSATSTNPLIIDGNGPQSYFTIAEGGTSLGYFGSFAGDPNDIDYGTGFGNNGKLHFTTLAVPRISIDNTGKIGVGITTPNHAFHINNGDLFVQSSIGKIRFGYEGGNEWQLATTGGGADLRWVSSPDGGTTTNLRHYFDQNGDVSIGGGAAPIARLDVQSNSASSATSNLMLRNSTGDTLVRVRNNGYMGIGYNGNSYGRPLNIQGSGVNFYYDASTFGGSIFPNANNNLVMWSASSGDQNIVLQPSWGQVTIGTYTGATGYKVSINGKLICEEARVQISGSWPDYVFKKDYYLTPLDELEKQINSLKHLPNMPAAAEVENEGIDLGDMNKKLLEKVEEITLYIIDLNKENKLLAERISKLEKK